MHVCLLRLVLHHLKEKGSEEADEEEDDKADEDGEDGGAAADAADVEDAGDGEDDDDASVRSAAAARTSEGAAVASAASATAPSAAAQHVLFSDLPDPLDVSEITWPEVLRLMLVNGKEEFEHVVSPGTFELALRAASALSRVDYPQLAVEEKGAALKVLCELAYDSVRLLRRARWRGCVATDATAGAGGGEDVPEGAVRSSRGAERAPAPGDPGGEKDGSRAGEAGARGEAAGKESQRLEASSGSERLDGGRQGKGKGQREGQGGRRCW